MEAGKLSSADSMKETTKLRWLVCNHKLRKETSRKHHIIPGVQKSCIDRASQIKDIHQDTDKENNRDKDVDKLLLT